MLKILYIYTRFHHHASHSGYDQLQRYIPSTHYQPGKLFRFLHTKKQETFRRFFKPIDPEWYNFDNFCMEMELLARMNLVSGTTFHQLYGENFYRYLGHAPLRRGNRVVVSFHQPPDVFPRAIPPADFGRVARADAVVVVGTNQVDYFRSMTGRDNVHLVPHGIDTDYFTPPETREMDGPLRCLSVGWWLRDVDMIKKIIQTTNQIQGRRIEYHIVAFDWCLKFYEGLENVHLYCAIPDEQLRDLYRRCHVLMLPLNDCTANNAILEAMACGTPIATTTAGSIRDYLSDENASLSPMHDAGHMVDALLELDRDRERLIRMGLASRKKAEEFAWPKMARLMVECYNKIQ